jgi:glutamate racemase
MQYADKHILVFDSGIGGLSIVKHLRSTLGEVKISYLADNQYFPYGLLKEEQLTERVLMLLTRFVEQYKPDLIVIACNTASTLTLPRLRQALDIPVVGVVPAIKPAAELSESKVIGLLATPGTIQREYTDELIAEFAPHCEVIRVGSTELVQIIEDHFRGVPYQADALARILEPLRKHARWESLDTVVLACTHFPLAKEALSLAAPKVAHWVDSGEAIARRVANLLSASTPHSNQQQKCIALFTETSNLNEHFFAQLSHYGFSGVTKLENK